MTDKPEQENRVDVVLTGGMAQRFVDWYWGGDLLEVANLQFIAARQIVSLKLGGRQLELLDLEVSRIGEHNDLVVRFAVQDEGKLLLAE